MQKMEILRVDNKEIEILNTENLRRMANVAN
jgi:hypothetical protein